LSKSSLYIKKSSQDRILFNSESFSRKIDFLIIVDSEFSLYTACRSKRANTLW